MAFSKRRLSKTVDMTSEQSSQRYTFCHHSSGHEPLAHVWKNSIAFNPMYSRHHRCGACRLAVQDVIPSPLLLTRTRRWRRRLYLSPRPKFHSYCKVISGVQQKEDLKLTTRPSSSPEYRHVGIGVMQVMPASVLSPFSFL